MVSVSDGINKDVLSRYIQLIPLTLETSFHITSGPGIVQERALMYAILRQVLELKQYHAVLNSLIRRNAPVQWEDNKSKYETAVQQCNINSDGKYLPYMIERVRGALLDVQSGGSYRRTRQ